MPQPSNPSESVIMERLKRLDSQIRVEYDLISHRMTWLVVSHAFLLSAFVVVRVNTREDWPTDLATIRWLLPAIGIITAGLVGIAVRAAHDVIDQLKPQRDRLEAEAERLYRFERLGIETKTWWHKVGNLPPALFSWLFGLAWIYLLVRGLMA